MSAGNPTRFYGIAFGKEGNFKAETDGLITADTSPSVATKSLFWLENPTTATSIATFDDGTEGQIITVIALDTGTTLTNGTLILSGGSDYVMNANDSITLVKHIDSWYELARSENVSTSLSFTTLSGPSLTIAGAAEMVLINGNSGNLTPVITAFSGGVIGQHIYVRSGSGGKNVQVKTGGNILLVGTNAVTLDSANLLHLIKTTDYWRGVITY
jgi:hypothetical protein